MRALGLGSLLLALGLVVGCRNADCPAGTVPSDGRCVTPTEDAGVGGDGDGGALDDGGAPGEDAWAFDCRVEGCGEGGASLCDEASGRCVACLEASDCANDAPACVEGRCAPCTEASCSPDELWRWLVDDLCASLAEREGSGLASETFEGLFCGSRLATFPIFGGIEEMIRDGRTRFDPEAWEACGVPLLGALLEPDACPGAFVGTVADGGDCLAPFECESGRCVTTSDGCSGTCAPRAASGESCSSYDACARGLECIEDRCEAPRPLSGACTTSSHCAAGLYCAPTRTCQPQLTEGQACSGIGSSAGCAEGLVCEGRVCGAPPTEGMSCRPDYYDVRCAEGLRCSGEICRAVKPLGASCAASSECVFGARCHGGVCRAVARPGAACSANTPCPYGRGCIAGTCQPLPDVGEPCGPAGCLRGVCTSGTCAGLGVGASCEPSALELDLLDPCGASASCRETSPGAWTCQREGGPGAACGGAGDAPCREPDLTCDRDRGVCAAWCE